MAKFFGILCFLGLVVIFGTAGASDTESISLMQMTMQCLCGVAMIIVGSVGLDICDKKGEKYESEFDI